MDYDDDQPQLTQLDNDQKQQIVKSFILQAPPGEINDVLNDVQLILDDDRIFHTAVRPALAQYNHEQFTVIDIPHSSHKTVIAEAALLSTEPTHRYYDPRSNQSFAFDHSTLVASSLEPISIPEEATSFISSFEQPLSAYISNHFSLGAGAILPSFLPPAVAPSTQDNQSPPTVPEPAVSELNEADKPTAEATTDNVAAPESSAIVDEGGDAKTPDVATEVALVETADQVAEMAKEVEEHLKVDVGDEREDEVMAQTLEEGKGKPGESVGDDVQIAEDQEGEKGVEKVEPPVEVTMEQLEEVQAGEPLEQVLDEAKVEEEAKETSSPIAEPPSVATGSDISTAVAPPVSLPTEEAGDKLSTGDDIQTGPVSRQVEQGKYTLITSGHRYSTANFWTGRWRSSYAIDLSKDVVEGKIEVLVHYYEAGNVQLHTLTLPSFPLPSPFTPSALLKQVSLVEADAQSSINAQLEELAGGSFKSLRRALPVTRQKMEWEKVGGYRLGKGIGGGSGVRGEVEAQV